MKLLCPVKKTVWGEVNNLQDLQKAILKSGQPFGVDWSGPATDTIPNAPAGMTYYEYLGFGLHAGIDLPVSRGTEIYASTDGKVCELSNNITKGIGVVIYDEVQHCKTVYWHLLSYSVELGGIIKAGQLIGLSDNTGYSKGNHLHWEVKETNEHGVSVKSIDPMPYIIFEDTMDKELIGRIVSKLYQTWLQDDSDAIKYWTDLIDRPEVLENLLDQKIIDIKKAVNK